MIPRDQRPTTPVPPPDQVAAYHRERGLAAQHAANAEALWRQMTGAQHREVLADSRRRAGRCVDCGAPPVAGDERCLRCGIADATR